MTKSDRNPKTPPPQPPRNRTLLVIALAAAAVIAAFILWANMEPPPPMSPGDPDAQPTIPETAMQDLMNQIAHVREMIGDDTTDFPALASLGNLYFDANMYEEAIVWYKKALRIQPDDLSVLTDMAIMYRSLHKHDTAVVILRNVVALDSTWQQAWFNLDALSRAGPEYRVCRPSAPGDRAPPEGTGHRHAGEVGVILVKDSRNGVITRDGTGEYKIHPYDSRARV